MGGSTLKGAAIGIVALMLTAGCVGVGPENEGDQRVLEQRAQVDERTGGVEGVVTDAAVQPVVGANVTLVETDRTVQTSEDGSYAISNVQPGSYTLRVDNGGYVATEKDVTVQADAVSTLDVVLSHARSTSAYTQTLQLNGFFECGFEVGWNLTDEAPEPPTPPDPAPGYDARYFFLGIALCAFPNSLLGGNATNDKFEHLFELEPQLTDVVHEMDWEPTNQMSEWMTVRMEVRDFDNDGIGTIYRTQGPSPIRVRLGPSVWTGLTDAFSEECANGNDTYCGFNFETEGYPLQTRVFPAWQCASEDGGGCAVAQQPFSHVVSAFYNTQAPEGYAVFGDG